MGLWFYHLASPSFLHEGAFSWTSVRVCVRMAEQSFEQENLRTALKLRDRVVKLKSWSMCGPEGSREQLGRQPSAWE